MMIIQQKIKTNKTHDKNDSKLKSLRAQTQPQTAGMQIARLSFFSLTTITNKVVINNTYEKRSLTRQNTTALTADVRRLAVDAGGKKSYQ